ncbi:hypothetical protein DdX_17278 [Ditylenchus destructor]|uniref:Uncharacterized protein n=1 Tax=Ditylenchus destructor TaxID=166010 RepID=A0AAD4MRQ4_9BILA|nr:hypothetical protein DdX_17278 [Ditylenchus destructor]
MTRATVNFLLVCVVLFSVVALNVEGCQTEKECGKNQACVFGSCMTPEDNCKSDSDCSGIDCKNYGRCKCTFGQCS